jgi:hypothetical protein
MNHTPQNFEDILEICLTEIENGTESLESVLLRYPDFSEELRRELELALWLNNQKDILEPNPDFVRISRQYLIDQIKQNPRPKKRALPGKLKALLSAIFGKSASLRVLSFATMIISLLAFGYILNLSSRLALPGEALYPAKLLIEQARLALTINPDERAMLQIEFAQRRTGEIIQLTIGGNYRFLGSATQRLDNQIQEAILALESAAAADPAEAKRLQELLAEVLANQNFILVYLMQNLPPSTWSEIKFAVQVSQQGLSALTIK